MDMERAACRPHMALFFRTFRPEVNKTIHHSDIPVETAAKAICQTCPLLTECREAYKDEWEGVFGGLSGWERFKARSPEERKALAQDRTVAGKGVTRWTPEKFAEVQALRAAGLSAREIGAKFGISMSAAQCGLDRARKAS